MKRKQTDRISLRLPEDLLKRLRVMAGAAGDCSIASIIRKLLEEGAK